MPYKVRSKTFDMKHITGIIADMSSIFAARFFMLVLTIALVLAITGKGSCQVATIEVELVFAPSVYELSEAQTIYVNQWLAAGYTVTTITGYANSLPNVGGMSNEELAFQRALSVHVLTGVYGCILDAVVGTERKVVISFVSSQVFASRHEQHNDVLRDAANPIETDTFTAIPFGFEELSMSDAALVDSMMDAHKARMAATVLGKGVDTLTAYEQACQAAGDRHYNLSPTKAAITTLMQIRREDHIAAERYHGHKLLSTYHEAQTFRDSIDYTRKHLIRKGNYAFRMWMQYDAIRSHREGRPGAVHDNGGGYHTSANGWGIGARKARNELITRYGNEIPFLGWDEAAYIEYYATHSVFPTAQPKATAKKMSNRGTGVSTRNRLKRVGHKIAYFIRSLTACKRS